MPGAARTPGPSGTPSKQLGFFLSKFTPEVASRARQAIAILRKRLPGASVLVYDNYNALAVGFGPNERASEAILSIAVYPRWVSLFFLKGKGLDDPSKILKGSGSVVCHVVLESVSVLGALEICVFVVQAIARSPGKIKGRGGKLVIKSVSAKQRPRRPA